MFAGTASGITIALIALWDSWREDESQEDDFCSNESDDNFEVQVLQEIESERIEEQELQEIVEGNIRTGIWVLVEGKKKKSPKHYIGQVTKVDHKGDPEVWFLKITGQILGQQCLFQWLESEGSIVDFGNITIVLPEPSMAKQGLLVFPVTFGMNYNVQ
ncbi:hypothetical protein PR048_005362 [Dryococelus australis]|uniref:Uncharacterized protein n=1 Tax=Dryococelus australis TaxID=614101 RepID=A0ABQ9I823_9NEOP|nr:hypothetical protein PR048_005362 [Dryococelus australis]